MNTEKRWAGIVASLTFMVVGIYGYFSTFNAMQSLLYGIAASVVLGLIGFNIAHIVTHPKGKRPRKRSQKSGSMVPPSPPGPQQAVLTGDESLLDEVGSS